MVLELDADDIQEEFSSEKIYINCSFSDKDECKSLGGLFDGDKKCWYIPPGININLFKKWYKKNNGKSSNEQIYINCPFKDKDECKSLGGRFDPEEKAWYIPPGINIDLFEKWLN